MFLRMIQSMLPTKANKEAYMRDQQLIFLIENEPELFQSVKQSSNISSEEMDALYRRLDQEAARSENFFKKHLNRLYTSLYEKATKNWDKGLGALTPERRAELLRDCARVE